MPSSPNPALSPRLLEHLPKHIRVKHVLIERCRTAPPGSRLPSIAELIAEFGVAQGTIVRVLRALQAEGIVDSQHGRGCFVTDRLRTRALAIHCHYDILSPDVGEFPRLLMGSLLEAAGARPDLQLRHYFSAGSDTHWHDRGDLLEQDVRRQLVDGVIAIGACHGQFADLPVPVVAWHAHPGVHWFVEINLDDLVRQAVEALAKAGARRVAYFGGHAEPLPAADDWDYPSALDKRQALDQFRRLTSERGLDAPSEWLVPAGDRAITGVAAVERHAADAFARLWSGADRPDAIVCIDDHRTRGMLRAMEELGVAPGRDVIIATHANAGSPLLAGYPLILLETDPRTVADALIGCCDGLLRGTDMPSVTSISPVLRHQTPDR